MLLQRDNRTQRAVLSLLGILAGSFLYTFGLNNFIIANRLAEGGFVGVSLLGIYLYNIPLSVSFLVLNIPLLFLGWYRFGRTFILKTVIGVVGVSVMSEFTMDLFHMGVQDKLLASLYGGVFSGIGLGIIFRFGGTTGGADIIARYVNQKFGWSMGRTMFAIDVIVITSTAFIVGKDAAMYSLVALFVSARVIDVVNEGVSNSRAMFIISDETQKIADMIQTELERGTTLLHGVGGYTGRDKQVLYVVVSRDEISRVQEMCRTVDPHAFLVVNEVHDVLGEGFNPLKQPGKKLNLKFEKTKN
ncbi:YitT family protein [Tumebacillus flagellatus]|uniref:Membrane protein n=1 Tax=Tumebacillus flagellatus TaxID=1157490 RepID=A0A074MEN2_9BACL|nr:YitT family protein [Tumebacillus flagellatus]KEO84252.1 membrane protein [Tumebacillus flagellatus]